MSSDIIQSNNTGVDFLLAKRYREANKMFKTALHKLHSVSIYFEEQTNEQPQTSFSAISPTFIFKRLSPTMHQSCDFIHNKAIVLIDTPIDTRRQRLIVSSTVLYNMALLYHVSGLENCQAEILRKSMAVYQMSKDTLFQVIQENEGEVEKDTSILRLTISIMNNMGHLFYEQADHDEAKQCYVLVRYILDEMDYSDQEEQNELHMFWLNAVVLEKFSNASAA